jgi:hypothetical protein
MVQGIAAGKSSLISFKAFKPWGLQGLLKDMGTSSQKSPLPWLK